MTTKQVKAPSAAAGTVFGSSAGIVYLLFIGVPLVALMVAAVRQGDLLGRDAIAYVGPRWERHDTNA